MKDHFVTRGMRVQCNQGSKGSYLNIQYGHGVFYKGEPVLNANDHDSEWNFSPFGICKIQQERDNSPYVTTVTVVNGQAATRYPCVPKTTKVWEFCNEAVILEGAPAVVQESFCPYEEGGKIFLEEILAREQENKIISIEESIKKAE